MAKQSILDKLIADIDADIAALQATRLRLLDERNARAAAKTAKAKQP